MAEGLGAACGMAHVHGGEDQDAAKLQLGSDFSKAKCLLNADVAIILEHKRGQMQSKGIQPKSDFLKAYQYVNTVKQFRDKEVVMQVRQDLEKHGLEPFEMAQIGNLCPQDVQEAKALIPSLDMPGRDLDQSALAEVLEQVSAYRNVTGR